MKVAIFGLGYVGAVSGACFAELGHEVVGVDVSESKIAMINRGEAPIVEEMIAELTADAVRLGRFRAIKDAASAVREADISLVSVGTPTGADGTPDLTYVDGVVREIGSSLRGTSARHVVVIRSTVPPGTTQRRIADALEEASGEKLGARIHLAFNPEFLREGRSVKDFRQPPFTIIGAMSDYSFEAVAELYRGVESEVIRTDPSTAESIKLLSNAWHGLKVAFANEAARILKSTDVDTRKALDVFARDKILNISPAYLRPGFSFGGSCLPKDLRAMVSLADKAQVAAPIMRATLASNTSHLDAVVELVRSFGRRPVVLFGLAFKSGTDDMRESPFVALAERLIGKGYRLRIVDPFVDASRLMGKNKEFIEREIPHFVDLIARDAEDAVDEAEIVIFGHATAVDKGAILERGVGKILIDLAGDRDLEFCGADYRGAAW
ncbi:MAG: UDP-glucose/GDP-mannose dehydrogenase family protein [Parvularculaceae bacterium]|nr:UDP-glucose/GDP-mannose dehydrogenase family protein [Parvularculaceae bacterium]